MRRREKFVISSIVLSLALSALQYINVDWRYFGIAALTALTYFASAWALSEDLQPYEWVTILPQPALYAAAVGLFYFLLPSSITSRLIVLAVFGIGMYGQYLTANIYSVAKGRTIQLVYAAHAIGLFFTLLTSILLTNTIFSLNLAFYGTAILVAAAHYLLILTSLWSIKLETTISKEVLILSGIVASVLAEFAAIFSLLPLSIWYVSLFIMAILYVSLSILQSLLKGRLFQSTLQEYTWLAVLLGALIIGLFPWK